MKSKILLGMALVFVASASQAYPFKDRKSPCQPVRLACMEAGYVLNDLRQGNRLLKDCMIPLAQGESATNNITGRVATVPAKVDLKACKATIHLTGRPTTGKHAHKPLMAHPKSMNKKAVLL